MNAIHVQDHLMHVIAGGDRYIDALFDFIEAGQVMIVPSSRDLVLEAFRIAGRQKGAAYDCIFVALALKAGVELKTRDQGQARIMEAELKLLGDGGKEGKTS